jgi:transcription elongation factor GreA-like protein
VQVLSEGQTIRHQQYGVGRVTESNTERTTIDFDSHGVKKFVTSIWTAELIGDAPTDRPIRRRGGRRKAVKK